MHCNRARSARCTAQPSHRACCSRMFTAQHRRAAHLWGSQEPAKRCGAEVSAPRQPRIAAWLQTADNCATFAGMAGTSGGLACKTITFCTIAPPSRAACTWRTCTARSAVGQVTQCDRLPRRPPRGGRRTFRGEAGMRRNLQKTMFTKSAGHWGRMRSRATRPCTRVWQDLVPGSCVRMRTRTYAVQLVQWCDRPRRGRGCRGTPRQG